MAVKMPDRTVRAARHLIRIIFFLKILITQSCARTQFHRSRIGKKYRFQKKTEAFPQNFTMISSSRQSRELPPAKILNRPSSSRYFPLLS